jgi:hypothetical protein
VLVPFPIQPLATQTKLIAVHSCFNEWTKLNKFYQMGPDEVTAFVNAGENRDWPESCRPDIK